MTNSRIALTAVAMIAASPAALAAQPNAAVSYPDRPIRLVLAAAPGGGADIIGRMVAMKLNEAWGQAVVCDNRAGAGGAIGTEIVARARPDGYTILMRYSSMTTTPPFYPKLPYDTVRDFAPVTLVASTPNAIAALPTFPARNLQELIALAKAQPGKINYASSGTGTLPHLVGELLKLRAGIDIVHIPYKSVAPSMAAQFAGEVQLSIPALFSGAAFFKSGRLRALAVTSLKRAPALPEVPTVDESGLPGFEAIAWYGVLAPAATPRPVVDKIQREIARIIAVPEFRDSLLAQHNEPVGSTPEAFALRIRSELDQWSKLVKQLGLKLEE